MFPILHIYSECPARLQRRALPPGHAETDVRYYQDRTERAEQWLHKIFTEIEAQFFKLEDGRRGVNGPTRPIGRRA